MTVTFVDPWAEPSLPIEPYELGIDVAAGPVAIGLLANGFPDSVEFLDQVQAVLAEALPQATFHHYDKGDASTQGVRGDARRDRRRVPGGGRRLRPLRQLHHRHRA